MERKFGEVNGYIFCIEEVLFVQPTCEDRTEYEIKFKNGDSFIVNMVRKRINRNGAEVTYTFSTTDILRELGCYND